MKRLLILLLLMGCRVPQVGDVNVRFLYGERNGTDGNWHETDQHEMLGFELDTANDSDWGIEAGFSNGDGAHSGDVGVNSRQRRYATYTAETDVTEIYSGIRRNWLIAKRWQPFIHGGLVYTDVTMESEGLMFTPTNRTTGNSFEIRDRDAVLTPYLGLGINFKITTNCAVGTGYRRVFGGEDLDFFHGYIDGEADSDLFYCTIGWSF